MKKLLIILSYLLLSSSAFAQPLNHKIYLKKNIVKLNLTSPILKNYSLQYERVLAKRWSVALSGRSMPATTLPFKKTIKRAISEDEGNNDLITDVFSRVKFANFAITPEVRFYVGKGYGQGFYIAPYYRFAKYKMLPKTISFDDNGENYTADFSGNLTTNTAGLLFGAQWNLGKTLGLDFWIAGPNIGSGKGIISGIANTTLNAESQEELRRRLEEIDIPYTKETIYVDANGAKMNLSGPWAGIRTGLLLTCRF